MRSHSVIVSRNTTLHNIYGDKYEQEVEVRACARRNAFDLQQIIQRLRSAARPVELNFYRENFVLSRLPSLPLFPSFPSETYIYTGIANGLYLAARSSRS